MEQKKTEKELSDRFWNNVQHTDPNSYQKELEVILIAVSVHIPGMSLTTIWGQKKEEWDRLANQLEQMGFCRYAKIVRVSSAIIDLLPRK